MTWELVNGKWHYFNPISDSRQGIIYMDTWVDG